uniref:C2H2-type domain-containing protein n=1 Tax=Anguilla anguilla TaxID=7936 RepID=A0A0E9Y296_ANGAN
MSQNHWPVLSCDSCNRILSLLPNLHYHNKLYSCISGETVK